MILSTIKLFLFLIVITIVLLLFKKEAIPFVLFFVIHYVLYTVFEVINITSHLRNEKLTGKDHKNEDEIL